ncbi:right-handed parallel beta-helix repeat-containing protein [Agrilutibacter solisilvae]|uniref:Right-handed parallel beta-helix repeat-containing protein n=1 Tax=Agrilutibacter solisilvae TaxID=2763317 RepID=A0A975AU31_9GAMM|nr:right-handed parallel beta-helix repeat-containing protein [Lysobacter solisilvae]QSX79705.1 right-handed parallel beta-helix repeat-containing protein [Lysobacter solisilvae]
MRRDLSTAMTSGNAVVIAANNVTLDCNGFKLGGLAAGPASTAWGVYASDRLNATVRHCNIRGFFIGLFLSGGGGHVVEDNRFDQNLGTALAIRYGTNTANLVQRNRVFDTGGGPYSTAAIVAEGDIIDNTVVGAFSAVAGGTTTGISAFGAGTEVRGNQVRELVPGSGGLTYGIFVNVTRVAVADNRIANQPAQAGIGIMGFGATDTFCAGNTITGFGTGMNACRNSGGNDWW